MSGRDVLVVMPSVPAAARDGGFFLDIKMVEGLALYARLWGGPVRCAIRAGDPAQIAFGRDYAAADLPFEVVFVDADATGIAALTHDAAVVLAAGDNHRDLPVPGLTDAPVVFIIEYTLKTRLRIIAIEQGRSLAALKNMVWTVLTERRRRHAFARSAGLQANGQPGYDAYRQSSPSILRYFDSRLTDRQQIAADALAAKQAAMHEGRPLRIVFSGRLETMKGADHLVRVAIELRRAGVPFTLDTVAKKLVPMGRYPVGAGEAYGMCLWTRARDKALFGFVVMKDGRIDQVSIDTTGATPVVRTVRSMKVGTQAEGCVVDDRTGLLYAAEEDFGLWRFAADPAAPVTGTAVAKVDGTTLVADAEGLALAPSGRTGGYLVASSQGDNAYTLYRLPDVTYAGRFRIGGGAIDGTSETDGIDLMLGDFGPGLRHGLMVAQDGDNAPQTQNFKFVAWDKVRKSLRLR